MDFFKWEPITPQELLIIAAIFVALFGERIWRWLDKKNKRGKITQILLIPLERLKHDILRIRDERNPGNADRPKKTKIIFSQTSFDEVNNHFFLFTDVIIPYSDYLDLPKESKTIEFFTHYNKNIGTLKTRINISHNGTGTLTFKTVNDLLERLELSIKELT